MAYNTGNPSGSSDPRDLSDSAADIDTWATSTTADAHSDRLGTVRKTWRGMESEFDADQSARASEFEADQDSREAQFVQLMVSGGYTGTGAGGAIEEYASGITVSAYKEIIRENGEFWRAAAGTTLPYTTIGAGMPEGGAFVNVGDGVLRQDLVQPVATFNSVADMKASAMLDAGRKARTLGYYTPDDGGGNNYEIVATGTGTDDGGSFIDLAGSGLQAKGLFSGGAINLRQFGVVGDGVADDAPQVQSALTFASDLEGNFGEIYRLSSALVKSSSCHIDFKGATLDFSAVPVESVVDYLTIEGSEDAEVALTSDAAFQSNVITVNSVAGLQSGDYLRIGSNAVYDASSTSQAIGEIVTIDSISGSTITTIEPLSHDYLVSDNAVVSKINMLDAPVVKNALMIGAGHAGANRTQHGFVFKYCNNLHVENLKTQYVDRIGVKLNDCINFTVKRCSASDTLNSGSGYGISVQDACQDGIVEGFVTKNTRHSTSTNNNSAVKGIPRRILFRKCVAHNSINTGDAFDTHSAAEDINFDDCHVLSSSSLGFNIECRSSTVTNCTARNTADGALAYHNESDYPGSFALNNFRYRDTGAEGVDIRNPTRGSTAKIESCIIDGVYGKGSVGTGLNISSGAPGIPVRNVEVSNVHISGVNATNIMYLLQCENVTVDGTILNVLAESSIGLRIRDCSNVTVNGILFDLPPSGDLSCVYIDSGCIGVAVDNVSVQSPSDIGSTGVLINTAAEKVVVGPSINADDCNERIRSSGLTAGSYISRHEQKATISAGVIDFAAPYIQVDTEAGAAADDLTTINGGNAGDIVTLSCTDSARAITASTGAGNLRLSTNFVLDHPFDTLTLVNTGGFWAEISRSSYS